MRVEVYEREVDAVEAAAERMAGHLVAAGAGAAAALPAGRRARAVLAALGAHAQVPWAGIQWLATDETCGDAAAPDSARELIMQAALAPNRIAASALLVPERGEGPDAASRAWEAAVRDACDGRGVLAAALLVARPDGGIAGLSPGTDAGGWVVAGEGGRVGLGADAIAAARTVVVVATGPDVAGAVAAALTQPAAPGERPLQRVLPDDRVTWFLDRAAAGPLLANARPVDDA